ncbi:MAG: hypothetical protein KDC10_04625 [Calditrichaeota bacterium]|nr:hypothetical protein [Calditrichota bacterium]MCB9472454.1 hypothetical protein [Candidatus Delongbacteria bacterium]
MKSARFASCLLAALMIGIIAPSQEASAARTPSLDTPVTIDAQDANLADVLSILAEQSGFNIVTGPELSDDPENKAKFDQITIHLKDTPISEAIDMVVRAAGLGYEKVGNSFLVTTTEKLEQEVSLNSYVINLKYANASEVQTMLKDMSKSVQVDTSSNSVVLRTSTKVIEEVRNVIASVDQPVPQVVLEAKLIEVQIDDQELMGIDWARLNSLTTILAENGKSRQDWMTPEDWGTPGSDQGWKNNAGGPWTWMNDEQVPLGKLPRNGKFQPLSMDNLGHFSRQFNAFDITLNYMLRNNKASILASSKVSTLNHRPAELRVVDKISYVFTAGGNTQQITVKQEEVGIVLNVLPSINPDGWITTIVEPEVSSIVDWLGPNKDIPQIKQRTTRTTVRVKDGESIIIAGLLDTQTLKVVNRVPLLSQLPFVGGFFRSNEERISKTDLIIQVTPHILYPEGNYTMEVPPAIQAIEEELRLEDLIRDNDK